MLGINGVLRLVSEWVKNNLLSLLYSVKHKFGFVAINKRVCFKFFACFKVASN